jgi:hypothetical protein
LVEADRLATGTTLECSACGSSYQRTDDGLRARTLAAQPT